METRAIRQTSLSTKIILALFGIFLTSLIFALCLNLFQEIGIWLGIILTAGLVFCGYYYFTPGSQIRIITWTMLATLIATSAIYLIAIQYLSRSLEGF